MNSISLSPVLLTELKNDLASFAALTQEILTLTAKEHQSLAGNKNYEFAEFNRLKNDLLKRLNSMMIAIKHWRNTWENVNPMERARYSDIRTAIQMVGDLIVKFLQLDRENQQALLRRGLVPARHVTACATPPSHYVANLYRRHNPN